MGIQNLVSMAFTVKEFHRLESNLGIESDHADHKNALLSQLNQHIKFQLRTASCVEVHFENKDSGFFLKHAPRPWGGGVVAAPESAPPSVAAGGAVTVAAGAAPPDSAVLSVDRFTVLQTAQPAAVRATYGPFSTKQTVPARYSVPDPLDLVPESRSRTASRVTGMSRNASAALQDLQDAQAAATHRLDVSAHAVTREVARDAPVLRVLFHAGSEAAAAVAVGAAAGAPRRRPCVVLHATLGARTLTAACAPDGGASAAGGGACLAQLVLPASWWPPLPPPARDGKSAPPPPKQPPRIVKLSYSVVEPSIESDGDACTPRVQVQPVWSLGGVWLVGARAAYRSWRMNGGAALLLPRAPLYPRAKLHVPLVVRHGPQKPITDITVKIRVKTGMRLFAATPSSDKWSIQAEVKARSATITAIRREQPDPEMLNNEQAEEVLSFLAEVSGEGGDRGGEGHGSAGSGRLVWSVRYGAGGAPRSVKAPSDSADAVEPPPVKAVARFDIEKDDIQAVVPISKNWEVLNTAVLTGRQVSQAMKVLIVSQAGQVADVTLQSSCHSEDESVLKVSSSCSSVYVDGSEIRGSSNASVIVKYGTYTGLAKFTVWMPEFPLEVNVDDFRLSQIKGWKITDDHIAVTKMRKKRSYDHLNWASAGQSPEDMTNSLIPDKQSCRIRFQQSPVEVYARFLAIDHDSGRVSYFVSRRTWLKVTDLVLSLLRVSDPRIASLHGRILQGRSTGRTEVQVLSPVTGRVIGAREIRVGSDKVSISRIVVRVISGLQLNISPDSTIDNGFISETTVTRRLTAQYQEGLLDIDIEYSDGTRTPLRDVAPSDYYLMVESLDPEIVAFAPMVASHNPRVIAVGEGNGDLLRINLLVSEECRNGMMRRLPIGKIDPKVTMTPATKGGPLASALASVDVDFSASDIPQRPDTPQNDGIMARGGMKGPLSDLHDILIGIPLKDENNHEPTVQARQHNSLRNMPAKTHGHSPHMTPVEIGMYVLLAAFCFAIAIFVVSCVVYASKFKPNPDGLGIIGPSMPMQSLNGENGKIQVAGLVGTTLGFGREKTSGESTTNAHDWVWLGRATIERHSGNHINNSSNRNLSQNNNNNPEILTNSNHEIRITDNPLNMNYANPDDAIQPEHSVETPSNYNDRSTLFNLNERKAIDTTTYCKRPSRQSRLNGEHGNHSNLEAPPLPPHGIPLDGKPFSMQLMSSSSVPEEYKPPVPPHRNIAANSNGRSTTHRILADTIMPPTRRNSRQHRRERSGSRNANGNNGHFEDNLLQSVAGDSMNRLLAHEISFTHNCNDNLLLANTPEHNQRKSITTYNANNLVHNLTKEDCAGMFEFENDFPIVTNNVECRDIVLSKKDLKTKDNNLVKVQSPDSMKVSGTGLGEVRFRRKHNRLDCNDDSASSTDFVQLSAENDGTNSNRTSPEVKRATIVGNPMFATHSKGITTSDDIPTESLGLDDLEMDYNQILHYFHNLKESNA